MTAFRVFIYADGLVLPLVVPVTCDSASLTDRLQQIFAHDLVATRAEIWDGATMIMQIDAGGIAALTRLPFSHEMPPVGLQPVDLDNTVH